MFTLSSGYPGENCRISPFLSVPRTFKKPSIWHSSLDWRWTLSWKCPNGRDKIWGLFRAHSSPPLVMQTGFWDLVWALASGARAVGASVGAVWAELLCFGYSSEALGRRQGGGVEALFHRLDLAHYVGERVEEVFRSLWIVCRGSAFSWDGIQLSSNS